MGPHKKGGISQPIEPIQTPEEVKINELSQEQADIQHELLDKKCWTCSKRTVITTVIFLAIVATLLTLFFVYNAEIKDLADTYVDFMKESPWFAIPLYMLFFAFLIPFCIPDTVFILFGAYIFGNAFGFLPGFFIFVFVDYICQMTGAFLAFLNGRYLFRRCIQNCIKTRPKVLALSEALSHNAKKLVALLRICTLNPYYIFNYVCSVTNMRAWDYIIGNTTIILCDAPYIYVCASITDLSQVENSSSNLGNWYYVLIGISIVIVIIVIIIVFFLARKELRRTLKKIEEEKEELKRQQEQRISDPEVDRPVENEEQPPTN